MKKNRGKTQKIYEEIIKRDLMVKYT